MAVECIGPGYKSILTDLITRDMAKNVLLEILKGVPLCEPMPTTLSAEGKAQVEAQRKKAPEWNLAVDYTDESGKTNVASDGKPFSPSSLVKHLGLKMSGQQTTCDGEKCTALSVVDILRLNGYVVACEDEKGLTLDCVKSIAGGKAMHVFHPAVLTMKKAAAAKLSEPARSALAVGRTWTPAGK